MKLYRFSPIKNEDELFNAIKYIHFECHKLCKNTFGQYLKNAGNIGVFTHYPQEYDYLISVRKKITQSSDNLDQKYFNLLKPIIIPEKDGIPETKYTELYIRKPDPYRHHVGDIDFYLEPEEYKKLKQSLIEGKSLKDARIFPRNDLDMIELFNPDSDAIAYVSTKTETKIVRIKQSDETNL